MTAGEKIVVSKFRHFYATADGPVQATEAIDLAIRAGEFVTLVGPSGCGKTTLLKAIAGFLRPTEGTITCDGKPVREPGRDRGVVFQEFAILPWRTVGRNISHGLEIARVPRLTAATRKTVFFITHSVDEAVFLGDRVLVMTRRPGKIKAVIEVPGRASGRDWESFKLDAGMQGIAEQVLRLVREERGAAAPSTSDAQRAETIRSQQAAGDSLPPEGRGMRGHPVAHVRDGDPG